MPPSVGHAARTSGFFTGLLIRIDNWSFLPGCALEICCSQKALFDDAEYWNVPDDESQSLIANEDGAPVSENVGESAPSCACVHVAHRA